MNLTWDQVDGVIQRAVARGLGKRGPCLHRKIGVDEKAFEKGHEYVTIVHDAGSESVIHVADERKTEVLTDFYHPFSAEELRQVESVTMDMSGWYIEATRSAMADGDKKIGFDKFHSAKHLGDGVNEVRRTEHRQLLQPGHRLSKTRYLWLKQPVNLTDESRVEFEPLRTSNLKTARAWALKETAMRLWHYTSRTWAKRGWLRWYGWAIRSRLEPMNKVARRIKGQLQGVITAVVKKTTNARAEGLNSIVQGIKHTARGFRNKERFKWAIYSHLGGLDLCPAGIVR